MEIIPLRRASDWEERLRTLLDRLSEERFKWGTHDCALFAASAVKAMCDVDPAEGIRGTYDSEASAKEVLRDHCARTLLKTVKSWLGDPKPVSLAQRGDIVMRDRTTTGICVGKHSYFIGALFGRNGLITLPTRDCKYAFSVPFA